MQASDTPICDLPCRGSAEFGPVRDWVESFTFTPDGCVADEVYVETVGW